ncbi:hypothetical protein [Thermophagus xiamenensis]|uniref:Uncharacterized protein n=1 Tax=Thermophagus xiamenensis TaxID=385682 RepID=A0A1I1VW25_9BACT|nr:hypothetical protein [Thermophagus xiamenensis]SFD87182.1 hypothetical protein SAMN05444380_10398 [Thermophagus xiamenensis]
MLSNLNTSLSNLAIWATFSSSVVSISLEGESYLTPQFDVKFEHHVNIADWKDNAFNQSFDYSFHNEEIEKINTIISFTRNLLKNSKDIDNEFVEIVSSNFWDLI